MRTGQCGWRLIVFVEEEALRNSLGHQTAVGKHWFDTISEGVLLVHELK